MPLSVVIRWRARCFRPRSEITPSIAEVSDDDAHRLSPHHDSLRFHRHRLLLGVDLAQISTARLWCIWAWIVSMKVVYFDAWKPWRHFEPIAWIISASYNMRLQRWWFLKSEAAIYHIASNESNERKWRRPIITEAHTRCRHLYHQAIKKRRGPWLGSEMRRHAELLYNLIYNDIGRNENHRHEIYTSPYIQPISSRYHSHEISSCRMLHDDFYRLNRGHGRAFAISFLI